MLSKAIKDAIKAVIKSYYRGAMPKNWYFADNFLCLWKLMVPHFKLIWQCIEVNMQCNLKVTWRKCQYDNAFSSSHEKTVSTTIDSTTA